MQVQDVMVRGVISVGPDIPVRVAAHAMDRNGVSPLPLIDITARLVGIVSEGDLIRRAEIGNLVVGIVRELTCSRHWLDECRGDVRPAGRPPV